MNARYTQRIMRAVMETRLALVMGSTQLVARRAVGLLALAACAGASPSTDGAIVAACPAAAAACAKDASCHAYGVHGASFQLHGCADAKALVPNLDWTIYVPTDATKHAFKPLGKKVNVDEAKCAEHPKTTQGHCQSSPSRPPTHGHPVPAPSPRPYDSIGSIDVGTLENTIFWWRNKTYVLENIGCNYSELLPFASAAMHLHLCTIYIVVQYLTTWPLCFVPRRNMVRRVVSRF